ncbi:ABC transporter permease [Parasegetibacter sp. NRK P23]|uniref:cell division protein FtsX n=1 Tax=Parasegetibacter sp. NRK P23 TaxID=2942999 RepID=UPI00204465C7|nr:permease-like cell division protein FtsX [Parasegetibacter sp. NRK P23]MCM5529599.1 permease-like cell division protein FtsX [Parasegetibacter sp. NRK P23]
MSQIGKASAKRSSPSYFMSILGVSLVLLILGILGWIVINANKLGQYFKENVEVRVYLRENITAKDSTELVDYVKTQPYVKSYTYVTKEMAKDKFMKDGNADWGKVLDYNPLPASIEFKLYDEYVQKDSLLKIKNTFQEKLAVSSAEYPDAVVDSVNKNVQQASLVLLVIAVILGIVVIFLIDNTIKLAMFSNRFLIKTMQMVGATRWFIAKPLDMRAILNGALSGLLAIAGIIALIFVAEKYIPEIRAIRDMNMLAILFAIIILLGIAISFFSTHRSVIKYLKMKLDDLY